MNLILKLNNLYLNYSHIYLVKNKFKVIKEFKKLENYIILNGSIPNLDKIIFEQLNFTTSFNNYRYLYILSNIKISDKIQKKLFNFAFKFLNNFIHSNFYYPHIHYLLKILSTLSFNEIEDKVIELKSKPIFNIYLKEIIFLLGNVGTKNSIPILMDILKKNYYYRELCFLAIGKISSYRRYPNIKRTHLKEYLNFSYKLMVKKDYSLHSRFFYYSLSEIFLIPNGIEGKIYNKFSELLFLLEYENIYIAILKKIINNFDLSSYEKILLEKIYFDKY